MRFSLTRTLSAAAIIGALATIPSFVGAQAVASVCKDGTPSAASGRGACAGHGGVDAKATKTAKAKARADAKAAKAAEQSAAKTEKKEAKATRAASRRASAPAPEATRPAPAPTRVSSRARAASAPAAASSGAKDDNDPTNALAQCNDGMYSHASNRRGACSRHGGVKSWLHG